MRLILIIFLLLGLILSPMNSDVLAKSTKDVKAIASTPWSAGTFDGLKFRSIGPAFTSGRISDISVNPKDHSEYYVAVAAGNVWKTVNSGITWEPIFDKYGSWSIADVEVDPNNPFVIWVGTGEYNSQRAIGYGDGIYRSEDGGKSWKNMGLQKTEHIGRILIDPRNSDVYVAAQGPLWGPGGERGLYKSTDNGKTWKAILTISENTGITDVVLDPRNPDILYAASYQRRRHVFTLINGGPESAIYKSTDAGATWEKLKSGLPSGDVGRIGLAISPVNPDVIYAIIEAEGDSGGFFRSINRGATWEKQSKYYSNSAQYYHRIFADLKNVDKVYSLDTVTSVSKDGGKNWLPVGNKNRHVDDHALWIDPGDTRHLLIGGDGGIYETFDCGKNWLFKCNLPVTQFYRVCLDNTLPFYYVYGGTQDNNSMGGPSRTISADGIVNADWFVTQGGDGFETQVDPKDSNIIYAQMQYGGLVRYDRRSGETISIQPKEGKDEAYRWNWNSPLLISPHSHTRLYFGANILFRSDDYGNTWKKVSGDLTRQLDRNKLPVMGKIQSPEAVAKNASTSLFGNITALSESPLKEGLIYVGTDDGLIQITNDGGENWTKIDRIPGVPEMTYVCFLYASLHDENVVYAAFDGRKNNDLKPYLLKSLDKGRTWTSITGNLPKRGTLYTITQDHVNPNLLFVGNEFAAYFSIEGGNNWIQLKGGLPVTQVRDMEIQQRENDLVLATFGRGFYILDNYTPLRELAEKGKSILDKDAYLFSVKDAVMFIPETSAYGQGETYFKGNNPELGAAFTYYLKESIKTLKEKRKAEEKETIKKGLSIRYPSFEELRKEDNETKPYLIFTVKNEAGEVVRQLQAPAKAGINRIIWDLRYPSPFPTSLKPRHREEDEDDDGPGRRSGMLVMPGKYSVSVSRYVNGEITSLTEAQTFNVVPLNNTTLPPKDRKAVADFQVKVSELARVVQGTVKVAEKLEERIKYIKKSLLDTSADGLPLLKDAESIESQVQDILRSLSGDESISKRNANQPPSISSRIGRLIYGYMRSTSEPTQTMKDQYRIAGEELEPLLKKLQGLIDTEVKKLEEKMESIGSPWTPGRIPVWKK